MKRGKALCRILAVLLICALVAGFAPVAETISAPAQETAAGAEPTETVTDVLPSGADGDPDAAKDPGETPNPGETPDPSEPTNPDETPTVPTIVSAEDTTPTVWAQKRTVTIQTAGPVDKVQYCAEGDEEWKDAAGENGEYTFELTDSSDKVVTYEVRALNGEQESETVPVQVGKIDAEKPEVTVTPKLGNRIITYTVTISDSQSGLDVDSIEVWAFYEKDGKETPADSFTTWDLDTKFKHKKEKYKEDSPDGKAKFEFSFTMSNSVVEYGKVYPLYVGAKACDKVKNEKSYSTNSDPDMYAGSFGATFSPSISYFVKKNEVGYRVGEDCKLTLTGVGNEVTVYVGENDSGVMCKNDGNAPKGTVVISLKDILKQDGENHIAVKYGNNKRAQALPTVYYVSGAPAVDGVDFYNGSAIKNFIHTITGGLMFAKNNELKIEPKAGNPVGAAYYWQTGNTPAQLDDPKLTLDDNGKVVLSSQQEQQKEPEQVVINDWAAATGASLIIPCPKDDNFSGYLHVVVWNEVGTCTQYVYKAETGKELKLTNYGVFNGADNGVAVFVTTPDGEDEKPYTSQRDVLDKENKPTGEKEDNWVQQVDFDVQWDENTLKTAAWKALKPKLGDNYRIHPNDQGGETAPVISVTAATDKVAEGENASEGTTKKFSLGANPKDPVSYSGNVEFSVEVKFTVDEQKEKEPDENGNPQYKWEPQEEKKSHTFTVTVDKPVYVQNYLNVPTVTASAQDPTNPGADNEEEKTIDTVLEASKTYGWYNGYDNVLTSLKLTKCADSNAPYTMYYNLTKQEKPNVVIKSGIITSAELAENDKNIKDNKDIKDIRDIKDNFNEDGVYTLWVWAKDAAGNKTKPETAKYTIKYDVTAPDVFAIFSEKAVNDPYYAKQRTIDIKVKDDLFKEYVDSTRESEEKAGEANTWTGKMTAGTNVSIETKIAYTHGSAPQFDGVWKCFEDTDGYPTWQGKYTYGTADGGASRDGDNYTLCITATDEAGNVTKTNTDGTYTKNGKGPNGASGEPSNCYSVVKDNGKTDFTIDQTTPEVSVRFDNNSAVNGKYFPAGRTATITVVEHNFDENMVALDVTGASGITKWVDDGDTHTATVSFLNDADCKFAIQVVDKAGNICDNESVNYGGSAAPGEFVIDTTAPTLTLTGVNGPFADACTPGFEGQDANMSTEYELHLMRSVRENAADDATALCSRELVNISATDIRAVFQNIPDMLDNAEYYSDGIYKLSVTIRDMADNTTTQEATFAVNRHGSFYIYGEALANLVTKQFAQNDFVDAQTGAWTIMEYNASPVQPDSVQLQIYRDNALVTSVTPEIKGGMDDATGLYRYVYELDRNMFAQDGLYKVQVRSTDEAGNLSENIDEVDDNGNVTTPEKYQCTLSFVIDNVDPEFKQITGLEKRRYREDSHEINFAVADTYGLARVSVLSGETVVAEYLCAAEVDALGGETKLAANQKPMPNELTLESVSGDVMLQGGKSAQTITFVAVDRAGNTYTTGSADQKPLSFHQKVTISTNGFVLYIHNTWAVVLTVVALAAIAFGVWYGVSKKKKREGAAS